MGKLYKGSIFLPLFLIIMVGFFLRWTALVKYGVNLSIKSDDLGYQASALRLLETGMLTYHDPNKPTAHIMPGQSFLLAIVFYVFNYGKLGLLVAKLVMISFGLASIYITFLIGRYIFNPIAGLIGAFLLAIYVPQILVDNLTLTESPYLFFFLGLLYFSLKLANTRSMKDFSFVLLFFFLSLFFRVQIALFPILLFLYLIIKRYPFSVMMKQFFISIIVMLVVLGPWWVRNYVQFNEFIPFTSGSGNPLLLGTYQGEKIPPGKNAKEIKAEIFEKYPDIEVHRWMEMEKNIAIERMKAWWDIDKVAMMKSYLIIKPKIFWKSQFYWIPIFNISPELMQKAFQYLKGVFLFSTGIVLLFSFKKWKEYSFLWAIILFQTYFNSLYFAYNRYALPLMPLLFIIVGIGITIILILIKRLLIKFPYNRSIKL